jgi:hypothetical protein
VKRVANWYKLILLAGLMTFAGCGKKESKTLFELLPGDDTGVHFANTLREDDQLNILTYEYFYNGGGVGAGDINNDGLTDPFFGGNMTTSRLYLNKTSKDQSIQFEDITANPASKFRKAGCAALPWWISMRMAFWIFMSAVQVQVMLGHFQICFLLIKKIILSAKKPRLTAWISAVIQRKLPFSIMT